MIFSYRNTAHISKKELLEAAESLIPYLKHLKHVANENNYAYPESSINLPLDTDLVAHLTKVKEKYVTPKLKYVIDVGIGGSNLGTKAIYDALYGYYDLLEPNRFPKILFADTTDTHYLNRLNKLLKEIEDPEEIIIHVISKSGRTTETIANLEIILEEAPHLQERLVVTTDFDTELWHAAKKTKATALPIPKKVGGRYSVFTAVGLFPLMCVGINIYNLLEGAMELREKCLHTQISKNPALISAVAIYLNFLKGKRIHETFVFHPELESLGKWYRQLMGESIGKLGTGITPGVSVGSTDLHSVGQLYLGGTKDKFFCFISSKGHKNSPKVPEDPVFPLVVKEIRGKSANEIMLAILEGVKEAYKEKGLPFIELQFKALDEKSLGKFMQYKMMEMMMLAKLLHVNAFSQPNVESYKDNTREILSSS